ncbi:hypothetical protein SLE2022_229850 [Rubroshorea leprosula]
MAAIEKPSLEKSDDDLKSIEKLVCSMGILALIEIAAITTMAKFMSAFVYHLNAMRRRSKIFFGKVTLLVWIGK